jgi:4-hydroxymandelate oxidase
MDVDVKAGEPPASVADYEEWCRRVISPEVFRVLYGSPGDPGWTTYTRNVGDLAALELRPRVLVDVHERCLSTQVLGCTIDTPIVLGPTGQLALLDREGEIATARAAGAAGTLYVCSGISSAPVEDIMAETTGPLWQQVFLFRDRGVTEWQVRRAAEVGCAAIVWTVSNTGATRRRLSRLPMPAAPEAPAPNLAAYPGDPVPSHEDLLGSWDNSATWKDLEWFASLTGLPVVVKGVQTAADARLALEHGAAALVVSNHGGRMLEGARSTIAALPEITDAVGDDLEIYIDGGFQAGHDVLKALALGARAVWLGRAARWGQQARGQAGVEHVLQLLRDELDAAMGWSGVADLEAVSADLVGRPSHGATWPATMRSRA